jgi:hypothetical protein
MSTTTNDNTPRPPMNTIGITITTLEVDHGGTPVRRDDYFGVCPECGRHDGYVNVGPNHVFVCREHRTAWCIGSNLFSSWHDQTPEQKAENLRMLNDFKEVEPIYPSRDQNADIPQNDHSPLRGNTLNITAAERDAFEHYFVEHREKLLRAIDEYREKVSRAIADWKPVITADTVSEAVDHYHFAIDEDPQGFLEGDAAARDALLKHVAPQVCRDELGRITSGATHALDDDLPF